MFTQPFSVYACEGDTITCDVDGFTATARIWRDEMSDAPDQNSDGFWPSRDSAAAGYVPPDRYEAEMEKAKRIMEAWHKDEWFYCGVDVTISRGDVQLTPRFAHALWCVECNFPDGDNDNAYLLATANELLDEALADARQVLAKLCSA